MPSKQPAPTSRDEDTTPATRHSQRVRSPQQVSQDMRGGRTWGSGENSEPEENVQRLSRRKPPLKATRPKGEAPPAAPIPHPAQGAGLAKHSALG